MPGCRSCTIIDDDDSRWTLKVGVGGLVRTVEVLVHVDQWDGPDGATFSYTLEGDPVEGRGSYTASRRNAFETDIALKVEVVGSGPMAKMWEAMGKPILPQLAKAFAGQLKAEIEKVVDGSVAPDIARSEPIRPLARMIKRLGVVWRAIFGRKRREENA